MGLGRNGDRRYQVRREVYQHSPSAARISAARDRVERRGREVPRADARLETASGAHRGEPARHSWLREGQERLGADTSDQPDELTPIRHRSGYFFISVYSIDARRSRRGTKRISTGAKPCISGSLSGATSFFRPSLSLQWAWLLGSLSGRNSGARVKRPLKRWPPKSNDSRTCNRSPTC